LFGAKLEIDPMKLTSIAGLAVVLAAAGATASLAQPQCPPADTTAMPPPPPYAQGAPSVYDDARDTAAIVHADRVAGASARGQIYRWQVVKYAWPRGDYDAIYGPGAFRQNHELQPIPIY
jgi:hypothetical protein